MALTISRPPQVRIRKVDSQCVCIELSRVPAEGRGQALQQALIRLHKANPSKAVFNTLPVVIDGNTAEVFVWFAAKRRSEAATFEKAAAESTPAPALDEAQQASDQLPFVQRIAHYLEGREWPESDFVPRLSRSVLLSSLELGKQFLVRNQKAEGNFIYQYDFVAGTLEDDDNQVRQAGALWSLALILQHSPDSKLQKSLDRGLKFFAACSQKSSTSNALLIGYPGEATCATGCVALIALTIIDYLRADESGRVRIAKARQKALRKQLDGYLDYLLESRMESGHFARSTHLETGKQVTNPSPYFDGEAILCLIKAARYAGRTDLLPVIEDTALRLAQAYTFDAWQSDEDSDLTKGFFQWSCMAFREYHDAGWSDAEAMGDYVLSLGWWMIHTHNTLTRRRNTGYAFEGIIQALLVARKRGDTGIARHLSDVIDQGLYRLTTWQVGGPLQSQNQYLSDLHSTDEQAIGGVMNKSNESLLRIDVTQHQMHAALLALEHVYQG